MSKLSISLRDSISAEKQSVAKKPIQLESENDLFSKHENEVHYKSFIQDLTDDECMLFKSLTQKLLSKDAPAFHRYEIMMTLYELNLINKNADYVVGSTNRTIDGINEFMLMAIDSLDEITRNNLEAIRAMFEQIINLLDLFTANRYIPFWLQLAYSTKSI